ncbi:biopolymer transporter ExbD [Candidatus Albibeggiatoa sp. nov. NOAA]|uniref:ExbD/TolR family protein n=1 Tax=Candidatus Albibeggiatoa sp. nov. NOAA TaxID=3162724 RepID=UPI0032F3E805|nr:biopolymer transporter ExbD [Thiotrichaceae bacterium]
MHNNSFNSEQDDNLLSEINIIPLVDVMLVLLIVFMITAPLLVPHTVVVNLPQTEDAQNPLNDPTHIQLSIDQQGQLFWQQQAIDKKQLSIHLQKIAQQTPQPELHLYADKMLRYQQVQAVMVAAQKAGVEKMGFVHEGD